MARFIKSCQISKVYLLLAITFGLMTLRSIYNFEPSLHPSSRSQSRLLTLTVEDLCDGVDFEEEVADASSGSNAANTGVDYFQDLRGGKNNLKRALDDTDSYTTSDYLTDMIPYVAPWAVLMVLSVVGWFCYCSIVMCPCMSCCKRDEKYTTRQKKCPGICLIVFSVGVLGVGLAGTIVGANFIPHVKLTECAIVQFSDRFQTGSGNWIGTTGARDLLGEIADDLTAFETSVDETYGDESSSDWLKDESAALDDHLNTVAAAYDSGMTVSNPNNSAATITLYQIGYILDWGSDTTDDSTYMGIVQVEKESVIGSLVTVMESVRDTALGTQGSIGTIRDQITSGREQMDDFIDQIEKMQDSVLGYIEQGDAYLEYIGLALLIIFGLCILVSCLAIAGAIFVGICGVTKCRICNHCSWCWSSLLMICLFLLATIMLPIGILFTDFCEIFTDILGSEEELRRYSTFEDVADRFAICLYGSGNLTDNFLSDELDFADTLEEDKATFDELKVTLDNYNGFISITGDAADTTDYDSDVSQYAYATTMPGAWYAVDADEDGIPDTPSDSSFTVYESLSDFNTAIAACAGLTDVWAFDDSACPSGTTYEETDDAATGDVCYVFADWEATAIDDRYGVDPCFTASDYNNLKDYYESWQTQVAAVTDDLSTITGNASADDMSYEERAKAFVSDMKDGDEKGTIQDVSDFFADIEALLAKINDELLPGLDCVFLRETFEDLEYAMCQNMIPTVFQIGICSAVGGILLIISTMANIYAVKRFGAPTKDKTQF